MKRLILIGLAVVSLIGCNRVIVEPAQIGKVLSTSGYSKEILNPGKYNLGFFEELVILDTSTNVYKEKINVILSDKLTLTFEVRFRGRIRNDRSVVNSMFNDLTHGGDYKVSFSEVYSVYGRSAVRSKARDVVSTYNVEDVHKNYARISKEVSLAVLEGLVGTPIELSDVSLGNVKYPEVVTAAVNAAKARKMDIEKAKAQAKIDLLEKTNQLALVNAEYAIEMKRADIVADYNKRIGEGITPELLELKRIEVSKILASHADESSTIYVPIAALGTNGLSNKVFK